MCPVWCICQLIWTGWWIPLPFPQSLQILFFLLSWLSQGLAGLTSHRILFILFSRCQKLCIPQLLCTQRSQLLSCKVKNVSFLCNQSCTSFLAWCKNESLLWVNNILASSSVSPLSCLPLRGNLVWYVLYQVHATLLEK